MEGTLIACQTSWQERSAAVIEFSLLSGHLRTVHSEQACKYGNPRTLEAEGLCIQSKCTSPRGMVKWNGVPIAKLLFTRSMQLGSCQV